MPGRAGREWNEADRGIVFQPSHGEMVNAPLNSPDVKTGPEKEKPLRKDYVNALALSDSGEAMILERGKPGGGMSSWRVVGGYMSNGEDPMTAAQRTLLDATGYHSDEWLYLGSYVMSDSEQAESGVGHFFCARDAQQIARPNVGSLEDIEMRWVSQRDLKYALLDGRVSVLSYAITISMALLTVLE